jgi:hypothetical protein
VFLVLELVRSTPYSPFFFAQSATFYKYTSFAFRTLYEYLYWDPVCHLKWKSVLQFRLHNFQTCHIMLAFMYCGYISTVAKYVFIYIYIDLWFVCRSQWPRCLKHELSSPSQTLESWVRIPLETWMSLCVYSAFVLSRVQVAALRRAVPPSRESYRLCKRSKKLKKSCQGPTKGCRAIDRWFV